MSAPAQPSPGSAAATEVDAGQLRHEAGLLYRAIFRAAPPAIIVERFVAGAARGCPADSADELRRYRLALARVGDLEALELAARVSGRLPALTRNFRLIVYLAEALPETQALFVNRRPRRVHAWCSLAWGGLRGAWKLAKGRFLLWRLAPDASDA